MIKKLLNRLYGDYMMPSRLQEYEAVIIEAKNRGFTFLSIRDVCILAESNRLPNRYIVYRHDIDSDPITAREMFEIEQKHNVRSSYYFRLSTVDIDLMKKIEGFGSEASYHFEEIATFAKQEHIKDSAEIIQKLPIIKEFFFQNLTRLENQLHYKITTVASHGDFANRKLNIVNFELLKDKYFREKCGIVCECYDKGLMQYFDTRINDAPYPVYYEPLSPINAFQENKQKIYFLVHPKQWKSSFFYNTKENALRLYESAKW